jgi:UTP--glucose-1-phosphate uridylyltransferase
MAKVRKAVIAAAGRATRQYPASTAIQKVMFPLVDRDGLTKPTIQIIAEEALDSGIEEICIVTQPGEESLYRDYFKRLDNDMVKSFRGKDWAILESEKLQGLGERLHFAEQHTPEGLRPCRSTRRRTSSATSPSCCCSAITSTSATRRNAAPAS